MLSHLVIASALASDQRRRSATVDDMLGVSAAGIVHEHAARPGAE
jgi:hypothetical protein